MIRGLVMCLPDASSSPVSELWELLPTGLYNQFHFVFGLLADDNFLVQVLVHQLSDVPLKMLPISWTEGSLNNVSILYSDGKLGPLIALV